MARAVGLLVRGRNGSRSLREREGSGTRQRAADEPQPALCARSAPDARNRRGDPGGGLAGLAREPARAMTSQLLLSTATLLFALDLIGTFVFALSGAASG